ncbi:MAG: molybdopterin-dependent oxidoreductase [Coriobacteriales bacterium]|nr:molybdopterin-dependent oxidoreductase [Coriobacteriales bacterium]
MPFETHSFSRRNFIKGAAVVSAAGALAACLPNTQNLIAAAQADEAKSPDTIFAGTCAGNCSGGCFMNIHVRDGQIVRTTARDFPDTQYNRICAKGVGMVGRVYGAKRLRYPMRRVGERGSGEWERITWDEAINELCSKWKEYTDEYGPEAMSIMTGSGNYHIASGMGGYYGACNLLRNITGASTLGFNVDAAAFIGWTRAVGGFAQNEAKDVFNSKTIIVWGANPSVSGMQMFHFTLEAKDKGARVIVIDPVFNATAAKADEFIPVRAGYDGPLAMACLNYINDMNWWNEDILKNKTQAPFLIKEDGMYLRMVDLGVEPPMVTDPATGAETPGVSPYAVWDLATNSAVAYTDAQDPAIREVAPINGIKVQTAFENLLEQIAPYTVAEAARMCRVTEDQIMELARTYVEDGPVCTISMMGPDHYFNGQYSTWPMFLLAAVTDNICKPGGGIGYPQFTAPGAGILNALSCYPLDGVGAGRTVNDNVILDTLETGMHGGVPITIKGTWISHVNPLCTLGDRNYTLTWMDKLDFIAVSDIYMTETAAHADLVLPASMWFESDDIFTAFGTHTYITWTDKAIEPLGESKPDYEIWGAVANGLGLGDKWPSKEDFLRSTIDTDLARSLGITYESLKEQKIFKYYADDDFVISAMATETGRAGMYYDTVISRGWDLGQEFDDKKERMVYWEEPGEVGEHSELLKKYPFHMFSDHMRTRTHSQWADCELMKEYEPEPVVRMCSADAEALGLKEGDAARIFNDRGYVVMKVNIHDGLPQGMVSSPRSFQEDEFIDGHYSSLPSTEFNQCAANLAFNDVAVGIEKA